MISAVQNAKRNALKSTLKFVFIVLPAVGVMCGAAFGVGLGMTFHAGISKSPLFIPLIVSGVGLIAIAWHYAKKIDQL
jgi:high-affinity Fe2+/Pb2+ permease